MTTPRKAQNKIEGPADSASVTSIARYTLATRASLSPHPSRQLPDLMAHSSCCFLCLSPALPARLTLSLARGCAKLLAARWAGRQCPRAGAIQQAAGSSLSSLWLAATPTCLNPWALHAPVTVTAPRSLLWGLSPPWEVETAQPSVKLRMLGRRTQEVETKATQPLRLILALLAAIRTTLAFPAEV